MTTATDELTDRQRALWEFMLRYQQKHGKPPTHREMAAFVKNDPQANATAPLCHLGALERKGYVRHDEWESRCWVAVVPGGGVRLDDLGNTLALSSGADCVRLTRGQAVEAIRLLAAAVYGEG